MSRKLSRHLLTLADDDDWKTSLYILLHHPEKVNLNTRTEGGDYLIHAAAFVACEEEEEGEAGREDNDEKSSNRRLERQIYALTCLDWIIQRDFTAVNKVAADGGTPLHCALAAASSALDSNTNSNGEDFMRSNIDDSDSDSDSSNSDDDEDDDDDEGLYAVDKELMETLKSEAEKTISIDEHCSSFTALSTHQQVVCTAIQLLLENDAEPNTPLANICNLRSAYNAGGIIYEWDNSEDEDLPELAFAKEAIVQQWTPLMLCIQWIILATASCSITSSSSSIRSEETEELDVSRPRQDMNVLVLPITILRLLLKFGADPTYMTAGSLLIMSDDGDDWNALHFLISSSHVLSQLKIDESMFKEIYQLEQHTVCEENNMTSKVLSSNKNEQDSGPITVLKFLSTLLSEELEKLCGKNTSYKLSTIQQFSIAILTNDDTLAQSILDQHIEDTIHSDQVDDNKDLKGSILDNWRSMNVYKVFPFLQVIWGDPKCKSNPIEPNITLLDLACCCVAVQSINLLLGEGRCEQLHEEDILMATQCLFDDRSRFIHTDTPSRESVSFFNKQKEAISILLSNAEKDLQSQRQRILDKALLQTCANHQSPPNAILLLVQCGADQNVESVAELVSGGFRPIHMIAGNCRGKDGVTKTNHLLEGSNTTTNKSSASTNVQKILSAKTSCDGCNALLLSLRKKNFHVSIQLWQAEQNLTSTERNKQDDASSWNIEDTILLSEAAIECKSMELFQFAIDSITSSNTERKEISKALAKILLWAIDERSGFGSMKDNDNERPNQQNLQTVVDIIRSKQKELQLVDISSFCRDDISGHTPLHLLLRSDRGKSLRQALLHPLCQILTNKFCDNDLTKTTNPISTPCAERFGSYTALHLAYALGCEESVETLKLFGADETSVNLDGQTPCQIGKKS